MSENLDADFLSSVESLSKVHDVLTISFPSETSLFRTFVPSRVVYLLFSLFQELEILGINHEISIQNEPVACHSLLGTAWMLVQFIHCNSVASANAVMDNERENRLRDELQTAQVSYLILKLFYI